MLALRKDRQSPFLRKVAGLVARTRLSSQLTGLLFKTRVTGHYRKEEAGQMTWIPDYSDKRKTATPLLSGLFAGRSMPTGKIQPKKNQRGTDDLPLFNQDRQAHERKQEEGQGSLFGNKRAVPPPGIEQAFRKEENTTPTPDKPAEPKRTINPGDQVKIRGQWMRAIRADAKLIVAEQLNAKQLAFGGIPTAHSPEEVEDHRPQPEAVITPKPEPAPTIAPKPEPVVAEKPLEIQALQDAGVTSLRQKATAAVQGGGMLSPKERGGMRTALGLQNVIDGVKVLSMGDSTLSRHYLDATGGSNHVEQLQPATPVHLQPKPPKEEKPLVVKVDRKQDPEAIAQSLYQKADALQGSIDHYHDPGVSHQNVTARRARIASGMGQEGDRLERMQQVLRGLANAHLSGTIPDSLKGIRNRAQVETLLGNRKEFPQPYVYTDDIEAGLKEVAGKPGVAQIRRTLDMLMLRRKAENRDWVPVYGKNEMQALADLKTMWEKKAGKNSKWSSGRLTDGLQDAKRLTEAGVTTENYHQAVKDINSFISAQRSETSTDRKIREKKMNLIGSKIPGFFPTPSAVGSMMAQDLDIHPGDTVHDPGGGFGDLLKEARKVEPNAKFSTDEISSSLRDILDLEGFNPDKTDFMERTPADGLFDKIICNPPFESGQDMATIQHAYTLLKPGGRMVALCSEGPFFRQDKGAADFRNWLDARGAEIEPLSPGSFQGAGSFRQTGVNVRKIILDKDPEMARSFGRVVSLKKARSTELFFRVKLAA